MGKPSKKRFGKRKKIQITFDSEERKDYLTGQYHAHIYTIY